MLRSCAVAILLAGAVTAAPKLSWVRQIGGTDADVAKSIARDASGNFFVAGTTKSFDFPATVLQRAPGGSTLYRIDAAGAWQPVFSHGTPNLTALTVAPSDANTVYIVSDRGIQRSRDGGASWTVATSRGLPTGNLIYALTPDPRNPQTFYASLGAAGLYKSTDGGESWTSINDGLPMIPDGYSYSWKLYVDPWHPAVLLAVFTNARAFRSTDGGVSWTEQRNGLQLVAFDPTRESVVYGLANSGLLVSNDSGATWSQVSAFPTVGIPTPSALAVDGLGRVYADSWSQIFVSDDQGKSWASRTAVLGSSMLAADTASGRVCTPVDSRVMCSTDGFLTAQVAGPPRATWSQMLAFGRGANGPVLFTGSAYSTTDLFVAKLDANGNLLWSTYFGGSADDSVGGIAVDTAGNVYVGGNTSSLDFPTTPGAYRRDAQGLNGSTFLLKISGAGELVYSTLLGMSPNTIAAVAVDRDGNAYVTGTNGYYAPLTITEGAQAAPPAWPPLPTPTRAYAMKVNALGSALVYANLIDYPRNPYLTGTSIAVDDAGVAYIGSRGVVLRIDATGNLDRAMELEGGDVTALAVDAAGNLTVAGGTSSYTFATTPGAFQAQRRWPEWMYAYRISDATTTAFVARLDKTGAVIYASLLGGEGGDTASGVAVDAAGNAVVSGQTSSAGFPTAAPMQGKFARQTGFIARVNAQGTALASSTFVGDAHCFAAAGVTLAGTAAVFVGDTSDLRCGGIVNGSDVFVAKLEEEPAALRVDAVLNSASLLAAPLAPGERIVVNGAGFGEDARVLVDGAPLEMLSRTGTRIVATVPDSMSVGETKSVTVESNGARSNVVLMPSAAASPAIYTNDGAGIGQALAWFEDGRPVNVEHPVKAGDVISIVVNGVAVLDAATRVKFDSNEVPVQGVALRTVEGIPGQVWVMKLMVPALSSTAFTQARLLSGAMESPSVVLIAVTR